LYTLGQEKPSGLQDGILMIDDINMIHKKREIIFIEKILKLKYFLNVLNVLYNIYR
jgi:hypothetical protein